MKSEVCILLWLAVGLLAGGYYFHRGQNADPQNPDQRASIAEEKISKVDEFPPHIVHETRLLERENDGSNTDQTQAQSPQEAYETYRDERVAYLAELGMQGEMPSLTVILSELTNRDPDIRSAAREAAIQFGSRDALPELQKVMSQIDDPHEKVDLAKAIELLSLTNVTQLSGND